MPYFASPWISLDHLPITLCTYCIYHNDISVLYFICNDFFHFYYFLSQLLWFFKYYFVLYIYILWFYILLSLRCFGSAFLYMAVFFLFSFALLMQKSLFSADNSFFAARLYIGISPIILFKNLTLFMCSNLLVRHYYLSCLCLYRLALRKNKYISRSATPIYSVFEAISKRRFLHRKKTNTSCRRDHSQQQKEVFYTHGRENFCFLLPPAAMHTILIQAPAFSIACAKRGFYTGKNQLQCSPPMFAQQCSPAIAKARFLLCTICNRNRRYTEKTLKTEILPRQKRGFYMLILADWAVAISFYSLLNLLQPVWKSLSSSVFSSQLACGNLSFYIL